jgi:hypothetical protein
MRHTQQQQMLDWNALSPSRPVAIDLTQEGRDTDDDAPGRVGGRLAQGLAATEVGGRLGGERSRSGAVSAGRDAGACGASRAVVGEAAPRFRLERLSRELVIDEIITLNPTATVRFLGEFDEDGLLDYLGRLRSTSLVRGRSSMADRPSGASAISAHVRTI